MRAARTWSSVASAAAAACVAPVLAERPSCANGATLSRTDAKPTNAWREEYSPLKRIGNGAFATVWLATPKEMPDPANPPRVAPACASRVLWGQRPRVHP